jgi:protein SCO1/2
MRLLPVLALSVVLACPTLAWAAAQAASGAPAKEIVPTAAVALSDVEQRWGIRILGVRLTAGGYMLDFRYHVVDPEKAAPIFIRGIKPYLDDEASGSRFIVPAPPKTGPLRTSNPPQKGRNYFMFFANPARFVKPGRLVTVTVGDFRVEHVRVMAEHESFPPTPRFDPKTVIVRHDEARPAGPAASPQAAPQDGRDVPASTAAAPRAGAEEKAASTPACHDSEPAASAQPGDAKQAAAGGQTGHEGHAAAETTKGRARAASVTVPDVTLTDQEGARTSVKALLEGDTPVVLTFLFTTCTTICPVMAATVAQARRELGAEAERIRFVSISIDPEHDTPEAMREFLGKHDAPANWQFLTGTLAQSEQLQRAFDVYRGNKMAHPPSYFIREPRSGDWWRIDGLAGAKVVASEYRRLVSQSE